MRLTEVIVRSGLRESVGELLPLREEPRSPIAALTRHRVGHGIAIGPGDGGADGDPQSRRAEGVVLYRHAIGAGGGRAGRTWVRQIGEGQASQGQQAYAAEDD